MTQHPPHEGQPAVDEQTAASPAEEQAHSMAEMSDNGALSAKSERSAMPESSSKDTASIPSNGQKPDTATEDASPDPSAPEFSPKTPNLARPLLHCESELAPTLSSRLFHWLGYVPVIPLTIALVLQVVFTLDARELWYSDEIRHADAFVRYLHSQNWFVLSMNGELYPDKPPLYFLFLLGLYKLLPAYFTSGYALFFTGTAVSAVLFLWAFLLFGRTVARFDGKMLLASGIVLLCSLYLVGLVHYARMDLLFSTAILLSLTCLFHAVRRPRAYLFMLAGYFFAGIACLIKGPLGLAIPFLSVLFFCMWQQGAKGFAASLAALCTYGALAALAYKTWPLLTEHVPALQLGEKSDGPLLAYGMFGVCGLLLLAALFRRLPVLAAFAFLAAGIVAMLSQLPTVAITLFVLGFCAVSIKAGPRLFRGDGVLGLILFLIVVGIWAAGVVLETGGTDVLLESFLKKQVVTRGLDTFHHAEPWHYYLARLPLVFFPWTLILLCLPYQKALRTGAASKVWLFFQSPSGEGVAFLWSVAIVTLVLLSMLSGKIHIYYLPALPAVSLLTGRALLSLGKKGAFAFRQGAAVFYLLGGVSITLAALMLFGTLPMPAIKGVPDWRLAYTNGFFMVACIFILTAACLWWLLKSNRVEGVLLTILCLTTLAGFTLAKYVSPSFNAVLSPRAQAEAIKRYLGAGYAVFTHKDYGGTYSYYANAAIPAITSLDEAQSLVDEKKKVGLVVQRKYIDKGAVLPSCFSEAHRQWIETKEYILYVCPPELEAAEPLPSIPPKEAIETLQPEHADPLGKSSGNSTVTASALTAKEGALPLPHGNKTEAPHNGTTMMQDALTNATRAPSVPIPLEPPAAQTKSDLPQTQPGE